MNLNYVLFGALTLLLISCSKNQDQKHFSDPENIKWIEVKEDQSNMQALIASKEVYYIRHRNPDYQSDKLNYWSRVQKEYSPTNENLLTRHRQALCDTSEAKRLFCVEYQTHVIDIKNNRVIHFSGLGSGYMADINFKYNPQNNLIQYTNKWETFEFFYDSNNDLEYLVRTTQNAPNDNELLLIKFKKI